MYLDMIVFILKADGFLFQLITNQSDHFMFTHIIMVNVLCMPMSNIQYVEVRPVVATALSRTIYIHTAT